MWDLKTQRQSSIFNLFILSHNLHIQTPKDTTEQSLRYTNAVQSFRIAVFDGIVPVRQTRKAIVQKIAFVIERT